MSAEHSFFHRNVEDCLWPTYSKNGLVSKDFEQSFSRRFETPGPYILIMIAIILHIGSHLRSSLILEYLAVPGDVRKRH